MRDNRSVKNRILRYFYLRLSITFLVIFTLLLPTISLAAKMNPYEQELNPLLETHRSYNAMLDQKTALKSAKDEKLMDKTFAFIQKFKNNPKFASDPKIKELLASQQRMVNYHLVNQKLNNCVDKKNCQAMDDALEKVECEKHEEELKERILNQTSSIKDVSVPCHGQIFHSKEFNDFSAQISAIMKNQRENIFQYQLTTRSLIDNAKALINFKYKFDPNFMKQGILSESEYKQVEEQICTSKQFGRTVKVCDYLKNYQMSQKLRSEVVQFAKELKKTEKKYTLNSATTELNQSLGSLNKALDQIKVPIDRGFVSLTDDPDLNDQNSYSQFLNYQNAFAFTVSKGAGPLLMNPDLNDKIGGLKKFEDDHLVKGLSKYSFKKHTVVNESDVMSAIDDTYERLIEHIDNTKDSISDEKDQAQRLKKSPYLKNYYEKGRKDQLDELIAFNPLAVAEVLMQNPENSDLVCQAMNRINSDEAKKKQYIKYAKGALIVVSLATLGVGAVAFGASYLTFGVVSLSTAAAQASLVGVGTSVLMTTVDSYEAYDSYQNYEKSMNSSFAGTNDYQGYVNALKARDHFEKAATAAGISLGLGALSVINIAGILKRISDARKINQGKNMSEDLKEASRILQFITNHKFSTTISGAIKLLGANGKAKFEQFISYLSASSHQVRVKFLNALNEGKLTPEKLKKIIEDALEAAKKCKK